MASAATTPNLNLPQWVGTEKPERTDFNAAFDALDTTVASHLAESASKHITESGSNPNGRYIKFDDGTMICSHRINKTMDIVGSFTETWTFPASFAIGEVAIMSCTLALNDGGSLGKVEVCPQRITGVNLAIILIKVLTAIPDYSQHIHLFAIARWK